MNPFIQIRESYSNKLTSLAVRALIEEANLTPKPGLVDQNNTGSHSDLTIDLMIKSAKSLEGTFSKIAAVSFGENPNQILREEIAAIGRTGESIMYQTTNGVNTHKGAIWAIGLLVSSASMNQSNDINHIVAQAGKLARYPDRYCPGTKTNGTRVIETYGVHGAKGEAERGFPHITEFSLPMLKESRKLGIGENAARLNALLALMANLNDTCILHRGGMEALDVTKHLAAEVLNEGGVSTSDGWELLQKLDNKLIQLNVSPGGSADLLAATLFLDSLASNSKNIDCSVEQYEFVQ